MKNWTNKQIWRITQTYRVLQPMIAIVQVILWVVIAVGINEWFALTLETFAILILTTLVVFNIAGYVFDKSGFFLDHKMKEFKISHPELWIGQVRMQAALLARFMTMTPTEVEEIIKEESKRLGL